MPPYNTRSVARRRALELLEPELHENTTVSPSATGKERHIRRTYSPDEEVPTLSTSNTLESEDYFDRPMTPDQGQDEEFQRSPTACSIEIPDEPAPPIVEDNKYYPAERAVVERMFAQLQEQKMAAEERMKKRGLDYECDLQLKSKQPANPRVREVHNPVGPKLPLGIVGLGRTGTWIVDDIWRPESVQSTSELPSVREFGEEREVQDLLSSKVTQEDLGRGATFKMLTPLPSFVTGDGAANTR